MSVILYARVSTGEQAERDLSIPAQFRALRKLAADRGWAIAAEYQDVGTARGLKERPGLMAAIRMASENKLIEAVLVHRVDRLARNVYSYLTLKTKLRQAGVRIVS
jgi:site-specific DNA recombinase